MMLLDGGGRLVQHLLVEDVVADRLPSRMLTMFSTAALEHSRLPLAWHDQRTALGFA